MRGDRWRNARKDFLGADVEEIWKEGGLADELGITGRKMGKKERKRFKKRRKRRIEIPEEITKKLGEANMMYALEDYTGAVDVLKEVVRIAPDIPDSYHTFGLVSEAMGDQRRALNFYMIAAHLTPNDREQWNRVASMAQDMGNLRQAIYCLSKVIRLDKEKTDWKSRWDRANLYAEIGDNSKAKEAFEQLHTYDPEEIEVVKMLARVYHRLGHHSQAVELLEKQLGDYAETCDFTVVNILCELYMELESYSKAIELIEDAENTMCTEEDSLPIDLQVKAGLCMLHLGNKEEAMQLFDPLMDMEVEQCADLYMDVADNCWAAGDQDGAFKFYSALRGVPEYDQPVLWSRMEHCLRSTDRLEEAIDMYLNILEDIDKDHPSYAEANLALANLYHESKRFDHALQAAQESEAFREAMNAENEDQVGQLIERARLHLSLKSYAHFLEIALPLVQKSLERGGAEGNDPLELVAGDEEDMTEGEALGMDVDKQQRKEDGVFVGYRSRDRRKKKASRMEGEDPGDRGGPSSFIPLPGLLKHKDPFQLFLDVGRVCILQDRHEEAARLIQAALSSRRALRGAKRRQVKLLALGLGDHLVEHPFAQECLVQAAGQKPQSVAVWNLLCRLCNVGGMFSKYAPFFHKLRARHPDNGLVMLMVGHCHLIAGSYLEAMDEYQRAADVLGWDHRLVRLCMGCATLQHAMTRRTLDRSSCLGKAMALLHPRGVAHASSPVHVDDEPDLYVWYNLGRATHHLGWTTPATRFYQRAIASHASSEAQDVRFAAAHNLALVLASSGAHQLAVDVRKRHCVHET
eukprot:scaffold1141_cov333-Pavlova_lutheri.AAC.47